MVRYESLQKERSLMSKEVPPPHLCFPQSCTGVLTAQPCGWEQGSAVSLQPAAGRRKADITRDETCLGCNTGLLTKNAHGHFSAGLCISAAGLVPVSHFQPEETCTETSTACTALVPIGKEDNIGLVTLWGSNLHLI